MYVSIKNKHSLHILKDKLSGTLLKLSFSFISFGSFTVTGYGISFCVYHNLLTHFPVHGHLDCFCFVINTMLP